MLAMQCRTLGGPENLILTHLPDPVPGNDEVVIDVHSAGVNFADGLLVAGSYQTRPPLPFIPGSEVAGTVRATGRGVTRVRPGDRVAAFSGMGGYAEQISLAAHRVHPLPAEVKLVEAATVPVAYGTSYHALVDRAQLKAGETVLVLGAAGGVGIAAVQVAKTLGAKVIAAASSRSKLEVAAAQGADECLSYRDDDWTIQLSMIAANGVDVIFDPIGGEVSAAAVKSLAWGGRFLTVGYASGDIPRLGLNRLLLKEASALGVLWGAWADREPDANAANMSEIFRLVAAGTLRPVVHQAIPMQQASVAVSAVLGRQAMGKIALQMGRP